jgi:uncharacterized protein YqhQ
MSDTHAAANHTHIGGQAVLEGIMMRGKYNWAIAVRGPDQAIHVEQSELPSSGARSDWLRWPVVRGVVALYDTMALAVKAFTISAQFASIEGDEEETLTSREVGISLVMGLVIAIALFVALPAGVTFALGALVRKGGFTGFAWNVIDGLIRIGIFFLYIWAISRIPDIQRVFAYHGAEHKTIHAYEHGTPLEPGPIQEFDTLHVRCGTSFLLMVMFVAVFVYSIIPIWEIGGQYGTLAVRVLTRILLLPLIAGLAYEVIKFAGSHSANPFVKVLLWPGLMLQKMTTRPPDDGMVEIAVMALRPVVEREETGEIIPSGEWTPPELRDVEPEGPAESLAEHAAAAAVSGEVLADA